jgi:hypothetical protein
MLGVVREIPPQLILKAAAIAHWTFFSCQAPGDALWCYMVT